MTTSTGTGPHTARVCLTGDLDYDTCGRDGIAFHLDGVGPALRRLLELTGTHEYLTSPQRSGASAGNRHGRT
ncbi:hypothetical protein BJ965_006180 [Streptomyces luteogriseus]|uniref:Uncharacterized protein n=1 Tax=Streptomyces luteogriseus TaxID=68233 RepID=A0A7W7GKZ9_9ACTN|nr:hypothetical protein [Streptomyces luteogriseus]MBB4716298.1 hypothetical protein [Streptomyces luteogriseus]